MMGDTVEFRQAYFRNGQWPQTLEDAVRHTAAYAGVHDFDFQDEIGEPFDDLDDWTGDAEATWAISNGRLGATAGAGNLWYQIHHSNEIPPSFVASFDLVSGSGGILFRGGKVDAACYVAWWDANRCGFDRVAADRSRTTLVSLPRGVTGPARVQVHARYSLDSVDDERKWLEGALFVDGQCYVGFAEDVGGTVYDWEGDLIGFAVKDGESLVVDNLTVSALTRGVEWTIIDPGSPPASGMSRAVGTTRVTYMCRHDNTLRVWRPGDRDLDWQIESGREVRVDGLTSVDAPTHVRVQAAIHESDAFDDEGNASRMHRFILHNDPNIMTEAEAAREGQRVIHDHQERRKVVRITAPPNFLLEPNDRIRVDGVDYRVVSVSTTMMMAGNEPKIASVIEAQQYLEFGG